MKEKPALLSADAEHGGFSASPPHPFRSSPWYDPTLYQRQLRAARRPRRRTGAFVLVVLGGVALPLGSLAINLLLEQVVSLGRLGHVAAVLAIISTVANLLLLPTRKAPNGQVVLARTPRSTWLCALLFCGALVSALFFGYIALLLLPLVPISTVAILLLGFGLCGLSPYPALAIAIIQAVRAGRATRQRLSRQATISVAMGALLAPLILAGGVGVYCAARQARFERAVDRVALAKQFSVERIAAINELRGTERLIVAAYAQAAAAERQQTLAEIYHRITDRPLTIDASSRFSHRALVRPWWFAEQRSPFGFALIDPTMKVVRTIGGF